MKDIYTESIVSILPRKQDIVLKYALLGLLGTSVISMFFVGIVGLIAAAVFALLVNRQLAKTDAEYEYVHTNDVFDVDVVVRNSKRKQLATINLSQVEIVAGIDSEEVSYFGRLDTVDFSGNQSSGNLYAIIYRKSGKLQKLLILMDAPMHKSLKYWIPEKVK